MNSFNDGNRICDLELILEFRLFKRKSIGSICRILVQTETA